jgi:antitoxin component YwqK of YwqJK toxin-antitoxin module
MVRTEKRYYESGALRMRATFDDDLMDGPEEEYYESGQLQVRRV